MTWVATFCFRKKSKKTWFHSIVERNWSIFCDYFLPIMHYGDAFKTLFDRAPHRIFLVAVPLSILIRSSHTQFVVQRVGPWLDFGSPVVASIQTEIKKR